VLASGREDQGDFAFRNERIDGLKFAGGSEKHLSNLFGDRGAAGFPCFNNPKALGPEVLGEGMGLG